MSQAYKCDLCGDCVDSSDNAQQEREVSRHPKKISGTMTDIYIKMGADVAHVCDNCFELVKEAAKEWVNQHL